MTDNPFANQIRNSTIIKDHEVLSRTRERYVSTPALKDTSTTSRLPRPIQRNPQIVQLVRALAPALNGSTPRHIVALGGAGTGKTHTLSFVLECLRQKRTQLPEDPDNLPAELDIIALDCERVDTEYRVLQYVTNQYAKTWQDRIPFTGISSKGIIERMADAIESRGRLLILVLDNAHALTNQSVFNSLLDVQTRLVNAKMTIITTARRSTCFSALDAEAQQTLSQEFILFPDYTPVELEEIIEERAGKTLLPGALTDDALVRIASQGLLPDAGITRALDFLNESAQVAEIAGHKEITEECVEEAYERLEERRLARSLDKLTTQARLVVFAIAGETSNGSQEVTSGDLYKAYTRLAKKVGVEPLTVRRVITIITKMRDAGVLETAVLNNGRKGRTRSIRLRAPQEALFRLFANDLTLRDVIYEPIPPIESTPYAVTGFNADPAAA